MPGDNFPKYARQQPDEAILIGGGSGKALEVVWKGTVVNQNAVLLRIWTNLFEVARHSGA